MRRTVICMTVARATALTLIALAGCDSQPASSSSTPAASSASASASAFASALATQ